MNRIILPDTYGNHILVSSKIQFFIESSIDLTGITVPLSWIDLYKLKLLVMSLSNSQDSKLFGIYFNIYLLKLKE